MGTGGAVELSWKFRPASSGFTEPFVTCDSMRDGTGRVASMRLDWRVKTGDGTIVVAAPAPLFDCDNSHGATGFDLPEGVAELSLVPICAPVPDLSEPWPAEPDTFIAPAIVQRSVVAGQTVSLGAVELVVSVSNCATAEGNGNAGASPCICCRTRGSCR